MPAAQVQEVCALVATRGARLTASAIAGILRHLGCDDRAHQAKRNVVAVEGAVVRNYDMYRRDACYRPHLSLPFCGPACKPFCSSSLRRTVAEPDSYPSSDPDSNTNPNTNPFPNRPYQSQCAGKRFRRVCWSSWARVQSSWTPPRR